MDAVRWNEIVGSLDGAHIFQTWEWGEVKKRVGWQVIPKCWQRADGSVSAAALILKRKLVVAGLITPWSVMYVPRGPLLNWGDESLRNQVLDDIQALARAERAIFIKIDPEIVLVTGVPRTTQAILSEAGQGVLDSLKQRGWVFSQTQVQFRNTVWLDISDDDAALLARMKQKTRYNIRLAARKQVSVRLGSTEDLGSLYRMYAETSVRDGFVIRPQAYYEELWRVFMDRGMADVIIAEVDGDPVAGLVLFRFGGKAWYLHGMSTSAQREKMPNYLLQWEAIRRARELGCTRYDLWGAPDDFNEEDGMWGVYRFKEGLGGNVIHTIGAWDFPVRRLSYLLYNRIIPLFLGVLRRRGKADTQRQMSM